MNVIRLGDTVAGEVPVEERVVIVRIKAKEWKSAFFGISG